jgi:hypothetical protein
MVLMKVLLKVLPKVLPKVLFEAPVRTDRPRIAASVMLADADPFALRQTPPSRAVVAPAPASVVWAPERRRR